MKPLHPTYILGSVITIWLGCWRSNL